MIKPATTPKASLFVLCIGAFLDWISYGLIYPLFALFLFGKEPLFLASSSDATRGFWLGALIAIAPIGQFISSPIQGALSDRIGRKLTLQIAYLIIITGYFLSAVGIWNVNFSLLVLGRAVTGFGAGNISVINSAVADLSQPHEKTKNFALITMAGGIGFTAGPFLGGKLSAWSYDASFLFAGMLTLLAFFMFTFIYVNPSTLEKGRWLGFRSQYEQLLQSISKGNLSFFFPAFFVFCFGWSFYWEFIPVTWIKIYGLNASQIGNFYAWGSACFVISSGILVRFIAKKFEGKTILLFAWLTVGVTLLALPHKPLALYWLGIAAQQLMVSLIFPAGMAIVSNTASAGQQGSVLGAFQSMQSFAFAITPFLGGVLLDLNFSMPLYFGGLTILCACFIFLMGYKTMRKI